MGSFADSNHLKQYAALSPEVIASIDDDWLIPALVDHIHYIRLKGIEPESAAERRVVESHPRPMRAVFSTHLMDAEIKNGGFVQFFWNSSGRFAELAADDLALIGAASHASIMARAVAIYRNEKSEFDSAQRSYLLDKAYKELAKKSQLPALDAEYFAIQDDLQALIIRFIRANSDKFRSP